MRPHQFIRGGWCVRVESGGLLKEPRERKSIIIFGWRATCGGVEDQKPKTNAGRVKAICASKRIEIDAISPRFDDVKDDDDDDGEFCFGRERGFKTTLELEL